MTIQSSTNPKIYSIENLLTQLEQWRHHQTIVFTNGCFDILHLGHIDYLQKAAKLGTKLIVGLNSDTSIQQLKGKRRPIQDERSRMAILAALSCVDAVVLFKEETPLKLIHLIKPHILVKGADYSVDQIVGAEEVLNNGGKVKRIDFLEGYSTTKIIDKIKHG